MRTCNECEIEKDDLQFHHHFKSLCRPCVHLKYMKARIDNPQFERGFTPLIPGYRGNPYRAEQEKRLEKLWRTLEKVKAP